jgi:O-antigen ligase
LSIIVLMLMTAIGGLVVVDDSAINRFRSIQEEGITQEEETGATRVFFWMAALRMARDFPFGAGANGFVIHSPSYIPEGVNSGESRNRAVHSSWFEALTETGYHGLFFAFMILLSAMLCMRKCRRLLSSAEHVDDYNRVVAIEAALVAYVIAMTFLNRMRAEVFYWCILYAACAYNIYVVRGLAHAPRTSPVVGETAAKTAAGRSLAPR